MRSPRGNQHPFSQADDAADWHRYKARMPEPAIDDIMRQAVESHRAGRLADAEAGYRRVTARVPNHADALHMLGLLAFARGDFSQAVELVRSAIRFRPDNPEAYLNLGAALEAAGRSDEARESWLKAVGQRPNYVDAHARLARSFNDAGKYDEAIVSFKRLVELTPDDQGSAVLLGSLLRRRGRIDESLAVLRDCIARHPNNADAYANLGVTLSDQGNVREALEAARTAARLNPNDPLLRSNLCYCACYQPDFTAEMILQEAREWARLHAEPARRFIQLHTNDCTPGRPLRIGYVSPDFNLHPVGRFMAPLLSQHDRSRFSIFVYFTTKRRDQFTDQLAAMVDCWRECAGDSDDTLDGKIRQDRIDILVDLSLHTADHRLTVFARKPAPVQVTWLAYPGTSGVEAVDYRLSDRYIDPPGTSEAAYSERTVRLPTYWCYPPPAMAPPAADPPFVRNGFLTFGSLNAFVKVNETVIDLWASVLKRVESSRLLLHSKPGAHWKSTLKKFESAGVDPRRVSFVGFLSIENYFFQYQNIDIALDTIPYNGGTTTCDALYMGVPVITLAGRTGVGRMGAAMLSHLSMQQFIARTLDEYVLIAERTAGDRQGLIELRRTLRPRMLASPLMDAPVFARGIESAFRTMWKEYGAKSTRPFSSFTGYENK